MTPLLVRVAFNFFWTGTPIPWQIVGQRDKHGSLEEGPCFELVDAPGPADGGLLADDDTPECPLL
jgi:hypothetical protein